jgi:hypothetical protein
MIHELYSKTPRLIVFGNVDLQFWTFDDFYYFLGNGGNLKIIENLIITIMGCSASIGRTPRQQANIDHRSATISQNCAIKTVHKITSKRVSVEGEKAKIKKAKSVSKRILLSFQYQVTISVRQFAWRSND